MKIRIAAVLISLVTIISVGSLNIASADVKPGMPSTPSGAGIASTQGQSVATEPVMAAPKTEEETRAIVSTAPEPLAAPVVEQAPVQRTSSVHTEPAAVESAPVVKSGCN